MDKTQIPMSRENALKAYFCAWIKQTPEVLARIFDKDIYYSESWGPEYNGIEEIKQWFNLWNKTGRVTAWTIKRFMHGESGTAVEWHFRAEYTNGKKADDFDGVSLVRFSDDGKIMEIKEFASKLPHCKPFNLKIRS